VADFDDDKTVVDDTPVTIPRCTECGAFVFFDDFTEPAQALAFGLYREKQCLRARDGHWWYCPNIYPEYGKTVFLNRK
jgi:hypothetical protein